MIVNIFFVLLITIRRVHFNSWWEDFYLLYLSRQDYRIFVVDFQKIYNYKATECNKIAIEVIEKKRRHNAWYEQVHISYYG